MSIFPSVLGLAESARPLRADGLELAEPAGQLCAESFVFAELRLHLDA